MTFKSFITILSIAIISSCAGQDIKKGSILPVNETAKGEQVTHLSSKIWEIYQDQNDNYWFGSNGEGLYRYDGERLTKYTTADGLIDNAIRGIQGDHMGNVYIEAAEGVSKYDGKKFTTLEVIKSDDNEWRLEPNDLWFHCMGMPDDVYRYDGTSLYELALPRKDLKKVFGRGIKGLSFPGMNSSPYSVFGINKDKAGNLWIGTIVAGAYRYDGDSFLWFPEHELSTLPDGRVPGVRSLLEDKNGDFWLSNFISKYRIIESAEGPTYQKLEGVAKSSGLFENRIGYFNSGVASKNGDLWMTTYTGGVWRYDGNELSNIQVTYGDEEVLLIAIYEDNQGGIWLGTDNVGLFKYNGETFDKFEPEQKQN